MIPDIDECYAVLKKHGVPPHIIQHSRVVHDVALYLCQMLNRHGEELDRARVEAGSLLHDIAKMEGFHTGESHPRAGGLLLSRLGYPEVAEIVRQHVVLDDGTSPNITETALVHYADKRVRHTKVVSLGERFQDLRERYGKTSSALAWLKDMEERSFRLEERIFQRLPIRPESLNSLVEEVSSFSGEFENP